MLEFFTPRRRTWLYTINPAVKFVLLFILLLFTLFSRNFTFILHQAILFSILLYAFSGYSARKLLLLTAPVAVAFASSFITMLLFGKGVNVWWTWGIIKISEESFYNGLLLGLKTLCFGLVGIVFILTSQPILLFYAMMQQFKLPPKYAYSFIASIRLLPLIIEELRTRANALKVRGVRFSRGMKGGYERLRLFTVPLIAQSIRRAQRVAVAMEAKSFHMTAERTYYYPTGISRGDALFVIGMIVVFTAAYGLA